MIIRGNHYMIVDGKLNVGAERYVDQEWFPEWANMRTLIYTPNQKTGHGAEPHYHDWDEFWLFTAGRGEARQGGQSYPIAQNTLVYTPMGTIHRFQGFSEFANVSGINRMERQKRARHILVESDGPPVPTMPGFVISGEENIGPFPNRGPRCPLSELRLVDFAAGEGWPEARLAVNEYWVGVQGTVLLAVGGLEVELWPGDLAILRAGAERSIRSDQAGQVALGRE